ncbi:carbohydrate kinase [Paenibacillus sp. BR2-3]|uniref:carbohydrate kinase family protein n=1 Tax=Paenibacillus sp. BR2-3 TaxID=3048494 RepID=UPI0039778F55
MAYDVVAIGEFLIDFIPGGLSPAGNPLFERNAGGAPVNVLAALSRLGKKTAFIGKVGNDPFGHYLKDTLIAKGIDDRGLVLTDHAHTTMAFVHLNSQGERSFHFCRQPGADEGLTYEEIDASLLHDTKVFHFGSVSMTSEPAYSATIRAVKEAGVHGAWITYDPNWRPALWKNDLHGKQAMETGLAAADIVKVSEEELVFLTGSYNLEEGAELLLEQFPVKLLLVTLGANGTYYSTRALSGRVLSYPVQTVDTTGAGDGFMGAFIYQMLEAGRPVTEWTEEGIKRALSFANAAGALATTRKGAIASLAAIEDIELLAAT